ncbi:MAG: hypothetical protein RL186_1249, partial [Pseudomonadota bacterium]
MMLGKHFVESPIPMTHSVYIEIVCVYLLRLRFSVNFL